MFGEYKVIKSRRPEAQRWTHEVYDLGTDPSERTNLTDGRLILSAYLLGELDDAVRRFPSVLAADDALVDEELAGRLRRLGYIR